MEDDIMHRSHHGKLAVGDFCVFSNVGAYTLVLKPTFIQSAPAVLCRSALAGVECAVPMQDVGHFSSLFGFYGC